MSRRPERPGGHPGPERPLRAGKTGPRGLAQSLDRLTRGLGAPESQALASLFTGWDEIVGSEIAAHAQPISLVNGVLAVGVDHPSWVTHLTYAEADLRRRLEAALGPGCVKRIELRVRPQQSPR